MKDIIFDIDFVHDAGIMLFQQHVSPCFVDGFLCYTEELTPSKLDYDVDDMIPFALVEKEARTFFIYPDGECGADIYQITDPDMIEKIQNVIENMEDDG